MKKKGTIEVELWKLSKVNASLITDELIYTIGKYGIAQTIDAMGKMDIDGQSLCSIFHGEISSAIEHIVSGGGRSS